MPWLVRELRNGFAALGIVLLGFGIMIGPYTLVHGNRPIKFDVLELLLLIGSGAAAVFVMFALIDKLIDANTQSSDGGDDGHPADLPAKVVRRVWRVMRKRIAVFMILSTPFLLMGVGLVAYVHRPLPVQWEVAKFFFDYVFVQAWLLGGLVLFPEQRQSNGPGTSPGRLILRIPYLLIQLN